MLQRKKPLLRRSRLKPVRRGVAQSVAADRLWSVLEDRELAGLKFRRREVVGPYVVDFICPAARLVLLIEEAEPRDPTQAAWLREHGYRVLLIPEAQVLGDPRSVLDTIARSFEFRIVKS